MECTQPNGIHMSPTYSLSFNVVLQRQPRSNAAGVVIGDKIYIIGGEGVSGRPLLSVDRLDIPSGSWRKVMLKLMYKEIGGDIISIAGKGDGCGKEAARSDCLERSDCGNGWCYQTRHKSQLWRGSLPVNY